MKKISMGLISGVVLGLALFVGPALAEVPTVPAWNVTGSWIFDYHYNGGTYLHDMNLVQAADGTLSGSGGAYSGQNPYQYPWTLGNGSVVGNAISFTANYNNNSCSSILTGSINETDGSMGGKWTDNCNGNREGEWWTTKGAATQFTGNHGQYVNSQVDKQEAAKSRVGMPIQSKGHTK